MQDAVSLRFPMKSKNKLLAPDLLAGAEECGMTGDDFGDGVADFLEGELDFFTRAMGVLIHRPPLFLPLPTA